MLFVAPGRRSGIRGCGSAEVIGPVEPTKSKGGEINPRPYTLTDGVDPVATESPRRRKPAAPAKRKYVKTTIKVDVETHSRWALAAAMREMDRSAWAVEVITEALKGLLVIDRRRSPASVDSSDSEDRQDEAAA